MTTEALHPAITQWFHARHGPPTPVQTASWPPIARGEHVLALAPTGSGKTLAASLMALQKLLLGDWPVGELSVLYLSPLKALSADVQRNLIAPLHELTAHLTQLGLQVPAIRVALRTGDTAQRDRAQMLRHPPEILVTTPESLHLLLTAQSGRHLLRTTKLLILDEIHAVAANKRGVLLMAGVEELTRIAGPVQRVALSATVHPVDPVARLVGGWQAPGVPRPVTTVSPPATKQFDLQVVDAEYDRDAPQLPGQNDGGWWAAAAKILRALVLEKTSTLLFTSSRRTAERLARELNEGQAEPLAWAHHGSLSQELRRTVEARLKAGELRAVCATSSLELGIDVGAVDQVVLVGAPLSVASALQRVGRAGHQVGATSIGRILPLFGRDLVRCAVLGELMQRGQLEPLILPRYPADVLAQVILARTAADRWPVDALYDHLLQSDPFAELPRPLFDDVVQMLAGKWAGLRVRELQPRLDVVDGILVARKGVASLVAQSGGVIADRGYFKLVVHGSGTPIGELDEEFVWERRTGDIFAIGAQAWQVVQKTNDTVEVAPARRGVAMAPFWRADPTDRGPELSEAMARFLADIEPHLDDADLPEQLLRRLPHNPPAVDALRQLLLDQRAATGLLPTLDRVIVELARATDESATQAIVHVPWGGVVVRPLGIALQAYLETTTGMRFTSATSDDCLLVRVPDGVDLLPLLDDFLARPLEPLLHAGLQQSASLGLQFRASAGTALLIPRAPMGKRTPLFATRERSRQLLQAVSHDPQFPLLADAVRVCLTEQFDVPRLQTWLQRWRNGELTVHVAHTTKPSPLADGVVFLTQGTLIYEDDTPLPVDALAAVTNDANLRPPLPADAVERLRARLMRTDPDWAPCDALELADALAELGPVEPEVWAQLTSLAGSSTESIALPSGFLASPVEASVCADLPRQPATDPRWQALVARWMAPRGPVALAEVALAFGASQPVVAAVLAMLVATNRVVASVRMGDDPAPLWCDRDFVQRILHGQRKRRVAQAKPRPIGDMVLLRALCTGLLTPQADENAAFSTLAALQGMPLPLPLWESDVLPARVANYRPQDLDAALDHGMQWRGSEPTNPHVAFFGGAAAAWWPTDQQPINWFTDPEAAYDVETLWRKSGLDRQQFTDHLFALVWQGQIHADGFAALRKGLLHGFEVPPPGSKPLGLGRGMAPRPLLPWPGPWRAWQAHQPRDLVQMAEMAAERAKLVALRHGVVHRQLLQHESAGCTWRDLLPALRRMDWSGELLAGAWFDGLQGMQLLAPELRAQLTETDRHQQTVWWIHSMDPASPCGLGLPLPFAERYPVRAAGNWLVLRGCEPVAVARRGGRQLDFHVSADDCDLPRIVQAVLARFRSTGGAKLIVEQIGDLAASRSPFRQALADAGMVADFKAMAL